MSCVWGTHMCFVHLTVCLYGVTGQAFNWCSLAKIHWIIWLKQETIIVEEIFNAASGEAVSLNDIFISLRWEEGKEKNFWKKKYPE